MFSSSSNQRSEPTTFTRSQRAVYLAHRIADGIASQIAPIGLFHCKKKPDGANRRPLPILVRMHLNVGYGQADHMHRRALAPFPS
jgi:hypothetical protein